VCLEDGAPALQLARQWADSPHGGAALDPADQPAVQHLAHACALLLDRDERRGFQRLARLLEEAADRLRAATAHLAGQPTPPSPVRLTPHGIAHRCAIDLDDVARSLSRWWAVLAETYEPDDQRPEDRDAAEAAQRFADAAHHIHRTVAASLGAALTGGTHAIA
jgi:hypothetical protein